MGHILCITSGLTGILNASFEVVNRLQHAGHECTVASPLAVEEKVRAQGLPFLQLKPVNFEPALDVPAYKGAIGKIKRLTHKFLHSKERREEALKALGMDKFMNQMDEINPDLVLIDIELHEHLMSLVKSKYKVVLLSQWFSTWKRKGLPPILEDTIPGVSFKGSRLGLNLEWLKLDIRRWKIFLKKKLSSGWTDRRSILQLYAKKIGFSKEYIPQNYWPGPFSYELLPVISMTIQDLDFSHDVRPNLQYVGAMVNANRKDVLSEAEASFDKLKKGGTRLIYCSVSTFKNGDLNFLRKLIEAVREHLEWNLIISLGGLIDKANLGELPSNVNVFKRVNQLQILSIADLSINHGGIHTINECIHFNVPMLIYSGKRSDQNGCAARVHHHGIGIMADKDVDTSKDIAEKIEAIFSNQSIYSKLIDFCQINLQYKTTNKLEKLVENLLNTNHAELMQLEGRDS